MYVAKKFTFIRVRYINIKNNLLSKPNFSLYKKGENSLRNFATLFWVTKIDNYGKVWFGKKLSY